MFPVRRVAERQASVVFAALLCGAILLVSQTGAWGQGRDTGGPSLDGEEGKTYVAGELIVTYEEDTTGAAEDAVVEGVAGEVEEDIEGLDAEVVALPEIKGAAPGEAREDALRRARDELEKTPGVEAVDFNYVRELSVYPNDPRFRYQWGFKKPGFQTAWNRVKGFGIKAAVVDSGIAGSHPDLRSRIAAQRDFVGVTEDGVAEDNVGHGTHVAGTVAAATNNGAGVAGGCPGCKLLVAKVGDDMLQDGDIAEGITWSADNGARVINLSLGGPQDSTVLRTAVDYAYGKGAVVVAAAGNENTSLPSYPAAYPNVIAVSATNRFDRRAFFSNFGTYVDVAAPGVDIQSTVPGGYDTFSGTSMASPHVSALAGLLAAQGLGKVEIRRRILRTATDLGPDGPDPLYGYGRINAELATRR